MMMVGDHLFVLRYLYGFVIVCLYFFPLSSSIRSHVSPLSLLIIISRSIRVHNDERRQRFPSLLLTPTDRPTTDGVDPAQSASPIRLQQAQEEEVSNLLLASQRWLLMKQIR